jgi:hypothetical protein
VYFRNRLFVHGQQKSGRIIDRDAHRGLLRTAFLDYAPVGMSSLLYLPPLFLVGPMTGALLRNWQGCCLRFSLSVALCFSPFLIAAFAARLVPWFGKHPRLRVILWWGGVVIWCFGAPVSFLHALS